MYVAHVDTQTLRQLEATIWGDSKVGSPIRISVNPILPKRAMLFSKHNLERQIRRQGRRKGPKRWTSGLAYISYGMDDGGNRRFYRQEGSKWVLTVTARRALYKGSTLGSDLVLRQVEAALWLFVRFGGAGSKSRKGFGAFDDVRIKGITSIEDCKRIGENLRIECGIHSGASTQAPSLDRVILLEDQATGLTDPLEAVDRIGEVVQKFAKDKISKEQRIALGTPRNLKGRARHSRNKKRHASPAHWGMSRSMDGELLIHMAAFPSKELPDSKEILRRLKNFAVEEFRRKEADTRRTPRSPVQPDRDNPDIALLEGVDGRSIPRPNERVSAVLLEKKTKKGDWRARHEDSGLEGSIQDPNNAPEGLTVRKRVELTVAYATKNDIQFRWKAPKQKTRRSRHK